MCVPGTRKRGGVKNLLVATWNTRTLNEEGDLDILLVEMRRAGVAFLAVAETHWKSEGDDVSYMMGAPSLRHVGMMEFEDRESQYLWTETWPALSLDIGRSQPYW